jgi:hypothetical protein
MKPMVLRQLRMKRCRKQVVLPCGDNPAIRKPGQNFNLAAGAFDQRGPDENTMTQRRSRLWIWVASSAAILQPVSVQPRFPATALNTIAEPDKGHKPSAH